MRKDDDTIVMERTGKDRLIPRNFFEILTRRYLPVLSLTYLASLCGFAAQNGNFLHYLLKEKTAYIKALGVCAWISIPAILWIIIRGLPHYSRFANDWYKITVAIMILALLVSYTLFPEMDTYGFRTYFAASIPVFFIMYLFFVKGGLPAAAAYPLSVTALTFLIYGACIHYLH